MAGYRKRRLNQALSVLYLSMFLNMLLFIRAPFLYILGFRSYVFCLLVV